MELELLKPELAFQEEKITSTVVVFGSTRLVEPALAQQRLQRPRPVWPRPPTIHGGDGPSNRHAGSTPTVATTKSRGIRRAGGRGPRSRNRISTT